MNKEEGMMNRSRFTSMFKIPCSSVPCLYSIAEQRTEPIMSLTTNEKALWKKGLILCWYSICI